MSGRTIRKSIPSTVTLNMSATGLKSKDSFSKSDPYVVVEIVNKNSPDTTPKKLGQTSTIKNTSDPEWQENIEFSYCFENGQELIFSVYDFDSKSKSQVIGTVVVPASSLFFQSCGSKTFPLKTSDKKTEKGQLTINHMINGSSANDKITFVMAVGRLPKADALTGLADPYVEMWQTPEGASKAVLMHRTSCEKNTLDAEWYFNGVKLNELTFDLNSTVKFVIKDYDKQIGEHSHEKDDLIGTFETSFGEIIKHMSLPKDRSIEHEIKLAKQFDNPKNTGKKPYITFYDVKFEHKKSFLEVIPDFSFETTVAIDFTGSNGDPRDSDTLHYYNKDLKDADTQYSKAIKQIIPTLLAFDDDKKVEVIGFGGCFDGSSIVDHCVPLKPHSKSKSEDTKDQNREISEIDSALKNVIATYKDTLRTVSLSGPTHFTPVLENLKAKVESDRSKASDKKSSKYHILVILTDGQ